LVTTLSIFVFSVYFLFYFGFNLHIIRCWIVNPFITSKLVLDYYKNVISSSVIGLQLIYRIYSLKYLIYLIQDYIKTVKKLRFRLFSTKISLIITNWKINSLFVQGYTSFDSSFPVTSKTLVLRQFPF